MDDSVLGLWRTKIEIFSLSDSNYISDKKKKMHQVYSKEEKVTPSGFIPSKLQPTANSMNRNLLAYAYCITLESGGTETK